MMHMHTQEVRGLASRIEGEDVPFGEPTSSRRVTVTLPYALVRRLVSESEASTSTVSAVVREAVTQYFAAHPLPEALPDFVGMGSHADSTASEHVDDILAERFREVNE